MCSSSLLKVHQQAGRNHMVWFLELFSSGPGVELSDPHGSSSGILLFWSSTWFYGLKFQMAIDKLRGSGTWEPCWKQVALIPVSALVLSVTWMHSWLHSMYEINLLLWVGHNVETVREILDSMQFSKSGVPVLLCSVQCQQLVIWCDFWMAQKNVSTKIQCKVFRCLNLFWM